MSIVIYRFITRLFRLSVWERIPVRPFASFLSHSTHTHTHVTRSLVSLISIHDCNQFLLSSRVFLVNAPKLVLSFIHALLICLTLGGYPFRLEISIDLFADVRQEAKYGRPAGRLHQHGDTAAAYDTFRNNSRVSYFASISCVPLQQQQ